MPSIFVEIKAAGHSHNKSCRAAADEQMRERFKDLGNRVEIPILYGVSALGTKLCFYKFTKATAQLEPRRIFDGATIMVDTAPRER